ncbi:MAG: hypothetical protein OXK76_02270 [Gammaproteobacteria bacterium]|nr:hypothetical protein [Gammaproteobacteria bacterium]
MFVLTVTALGTYLVNRHLLVAFEVEYLRIIVFIAATVQFTEMFVRAASPVLHRMLGIYLQRSCASFLALPGLTRNVTGG